MDTDNAKEVSEDHKEKFKWLKQLILIHIDIDTGQSKLVCGLKFLTFIIKLIFIKHHPTKMRSGLYPTNMKPRALTVHFWVSMKYSNLINQNVLVEIKIRNSKIKLNAFTISTTPSGQLV